VNNFITYVPNLIFEALLKISSTNMKSGYKKHNVKDKLALMKVANDPKQKTLFFYFYQKSICCVGVFQSKQQ